MSILIRTWVTAITATKHKTRFSLGIFHALPANSFFPHPHVIIIISRYGHNHRSLGRSFLIRTPVVGRSFLIRTPVLKFFNDSLGLYSLLDGSTRCSRLCQRRLLSCLPCVGASWDDSWRWRFDCIHGFCLRIFLTIVYFRYFCALVATSSIPRNWGLDLGS